MIDEKKLIEDLIHNDGMDFEVTLEGTTPQELVNTFQEFANKMKEGVVNLINAQPRIGFTSVKEGYPTKAKEYLCRCVIGEYDDFPFYMVLRYHLVDKNPHFQHETEYGLRVTHWMPFVDPVTGSDPR